MTSKDPNQSDTGSVIRASILGMETVALGIDFIFWFLDPKGSLAASGSRSCEWEAAFSFFDTFQEDRQTETTLFSN